LFFWLVVSSIVVGIGVCLEAPEATIALKRWYCHWKKKEVGPENERSLAIPASYLGLLLVIGGVAGEGIFEFLSSNAETALRAHDEQVLADTILEAGAAKDSAKKASDAAGEAKTKADAANTAAGEAQQKADSANATANGASVTSLRALSSAREADAKLDAVKRETEEIEERIAALGPRYSLLATGRSEAVKSLKPYAGQSIVITACQNSSFFESEQTSWRLLTILAGRGSAGWKGSLKPFPLCSPNGSVTIQGMIVLNSADAAESTRNAAKALNEALNKMKIISRVEEIPWTDFAKSINFFGAESPWGWIFNDPSLVVVVIGENLELDQKDLQRYATEPH
jgi:hypothetical protein